MQPSQMEIFKVNFEVLLHSSNYCLSIWFICQNLLMHANKAMTDKCVLSLGHVLINFDDFTRQNINAWIQAFSRKEKNIILQGASLKVGLENNFLGKY